MVYEGKEKYIFISYAHADSNRVLPIIEALAADGYRVWYDSGIEAGTEWPEYIEERLIDSSVVLAFMSPAAVDSQNCRNEINFALELKKEVLVVYLEETALRKGMRLQLNSSQSLFRNKHQTEASFRKELLNARILAGCRAPGKTPSAPQPATPQPAAPTQQKRQPHSSAITLAVICICAIALLLCVIVLVQNAVIKQNIDNSQPPAVTDPPATSEPLQMSDKLFDFTVELDGVIYQFPCSFQDLASHGWTISSLGISDSAMMIGGGYEQYEMTNNGKIITVSTFNQSPNAVALKDCPINGLMLDGNSHVDITLPKGITLNSSVDEIIAAYGLPTERSDSENYVTLVYQPQYNEYSGFRFQIRKTDESWNPSVIEFEHIVIEEVTDPEVNTERPAYLDQYKSPTDLSTDLNEPIFELGGDLYRLPCPVTELYSHGWALDSLPCYIKAGNKEVIILKRDDVYLEVTIGNNSNYQTTIENCAVYGIEVQNVENCSMTLSGGFRLDMTLEQLQKLITADFNHHTSGDNIYYTYRKDSPRNISIDIDTNTVENRIISITIKAENWDYA